MTRRSFLKKSTGAVAAVAVAPLVAAAVVPSTFRGWWMEMCDYDMLAIFHSVERRADGGRSDGKTRVKWMACRDDAEFHRRIAWFSDAFSCWAGRCGPHPILLVPPWESDADSLLRELAMAS
jgi:hypothetical protein